MTLTPEALRALLDYEPSTGLFRWRVERRWNFPVGSVAGTPDTKGATQIWIGRRYFAHRLAFLWMLGRWPKDQVDHRDLDNTNNAWGNLREATNAQNSANRLARKDSASGLKGVHFHRDRGVYAAYIGVNYRQRHLGTFRSAQEAHAAYLAAAREAFGEFARGA